MNPIETFFSARSIAVAGASNDRAKYGNRVFRKLLAAGSVALPVNPNQQTIEGHAAYPSLGSLPEVPESVSIITPPNVTRQVVQEAIEIGVKNVWMQPGAEDSQASQLARDAGLNVIDDGSCILVVLALR